MKKEPAAIRILLVEDNLRYARLISGLLEDNLKVEISHATLIKDALRHLRRATFDVVLLDLNLLDSPALEPIRQIRRQNSEIPIIVQTSINSPRLEDEIFEQGAQKYLIKEKITFELLAESIQDVITQSTASQK
jgi:CheY-like chemotaxis protein